MRIFSLLLASFCFSSMVDASIIKRGDAFKGLEVINPLVLDGSDAFQNPLKDFKMWKLHDLTFGSIDLADPIGQVQGYRTTNSSSTPATISVSGKVEDPDSKYNGHLKSN